MKKTKDDRVRVIWNIGLVRPTTPEDFHCPHSLIAIIHLTFILFKNETTAFSWSLSLTTSSASFTGKSRGLGLYSRRHEEECSDDKERDVVGVVVWYFW